MAASFNVYIDESGDEGFQFDTGNGGSAHWFILSAIVVRAQNDAKLMQMVADVRKLLGKKVNFPLHFRNLRHEQRIPYVQALSQLQIRTVTVLIHKPSLKEPETFRNHRLYHYGVRLLLERVSWLCRDAHQKSQGDGSAKIIFSNRSAMSYADLRDYVTKLINTDNPLEVRIESSAIKPDQIGARPHHQLAGLQAADAVASSFYCAAQTHRLGFTEPRYVEHLLPTIYQHQHIALGYGVKLWPKETEGLIGTTQSLKWVTNLL